MSTLLWRVFTYTEGDESICEQLVACNNRGSAQALAIANVKAQNMGKGYNSTEQSRSATRVLSIRPAGKGGVLTINRFPVAVVQDWGLKP